MSRWKPCGSQKYAVAVGATKRLHFYLRSGGVVPRPRGYSAAVRIVVRDDSERAGELGSHP